MARDRTLWPARTALLLAGLLGLAAAPAALAVPSFSRQTGMGCAACHAGFPVLTPFGRAFKAGGYTLSQEEGQLKDAQGGRESLVLPKVPPLSVQLLASYTQLRSAAPGTKTGDALLPDQLSLFYAGQIAGELGAFAQVTYDGQADHFSMDNLDVRYAHGFEAGGRELLVGATLNNSPSVTDLWSGTPTWGWPAATTGAWPGTGANAALVDGGLAQAVAGLGAYGLYADTVYLEADAYRSAQLGVARPYDSTSSAVIDGAAWYWRAALQHTFGGNDLEVGAYGLFTRIFPGKAASLPLSGPTDRYVDVAADAQLQRVFAPDRTVTARATWIHEKRTLDASAPGEAPSLDTVRVSGEGYLGVIGAGAGWFETTSTTSAAFGTTTGKADTNGAMLEVIYRPWDNVQLRAQYTFYGKLDGSSSDIDGNGRKASADDALTFLAWILF
jgi:hypothetical protein